MTPELSDSGVPQSQSQILASLYTDAAKKISQIVLHPSGGSPSSQAFTQARASMMLRQVGRVLDALKVDAAHWIGPNLTQAM